MSPHTLIVVRVRSCSFVHPVRSCVCPSIPLYTRFGPCQYVVYQIDTRFVLQLRSTLNVALLTCIFRFHCYIHTSTLYAIAIMHTVDELWIQYPLHNIHCGRNSSTGYVIAMTCGGHRAMWIVPIGSFPLGCAIRAITHIIVWWRNGMFVHTYNAPTPPPLVHTLLYAVRNDADKIAWNCMF